MATVATIIDQVRQICLLSTTVLTDAEVIGFIDEANDKIASAFDWPWLKATADVNTGSGDGVASVPAGFARLRTVLLDGEATKLAEISDQEAWERWGDDLPSGTPRVFWFTDHETIQVAPVESGVTALVLKYWKQPTVLDGTGDTPEFDDRFHKVLADWALYRVWQREEDYVKAQQHEVAFNRGLNDMARHYFNFSEDHPIVAGEPMDFHQRMRGNANLPWLDGV